MADKYVDFSATYDGDGTSAAQAASGGATGAYNTIVGKTFASGDKVWLRRAGTLTLGAALSIQQKGVTYIGWPISTDEDYSSRPQSGIDEDWDDDSTSAYPNIYSNNTSYTVTIQWGIDQTFKRIKFEHAATGQTQAGVFVKVVSTYKNCYFLCATTNSNGYVVNLGGYSANVPVAGRLEFYSCTFEASGQQGVLRALSNATTCMLPTSYYDCTFKRTGARAANAYAVNVYYGNFYRCTFEDVTSTNVYTLIQAYNSQLSAISFIDCTLNNEGATGATGYAVAATFSGNTVIRNLQVNGGGLSFGSTPSFDQVHVSKLTITRPPGGSTIGIQGAWNVYVCNVTLLAPRNVTSDDILLAAGSSLTLNNVIAWGNGRFNVQARASLTVMNEFGAVGAFRKTFWHGGTFELSSVTRDGNPTFKIMQEYGVASGEAQAFEVGTPGADVVWVDLTPGTRTLTLYGAHKLFGSRPPTKDNIWLEVEYFGADDLIETASSKAIGSLTADTATWSGDTNLTRFKIELTFVVDQMCRAAVRIKYGKIKTGAYTYIDPSIEVS